MMLTKLLIAIGAITAVSGGAYPRRSDDPNSYSSPVDTISRRLGDIKNHKNNNNFLRRSKRDGTTTIEEEIQVTEDVARSLEDQLHHHSHSSISESERRQTQQQQQKQEDTGTVIPDLKIIGGQYATTQRYPYLVSLTYFGTSICGGSLVAPDMVLTAAHCEGYATNIEIGRTDRTIPLNANNDNFERIEVAYEIKHPGWDITTVDNDYMLMKLVSDSTRGSLVTLNTDPNIPYLEDAQLTIMGWGDTNEDPDVNDPGMQLLDAQIEYVPDEQCKTYEGDIDGGGYVRYDQRLTDNMMCGMDRVGAVDEDTCVGDSGGPLIWSPTDSLATDLQVGLVSWGIGCASPTFPGVYARISSQYQWIRENVCRHSNSAPDSFDCDSLTGGGDDTDAGFPILEEDANDDKSYVVLEISLDDEPQEFSWIVTSMASQTKQLVATIPPGFYTGYSNYTFHHKLQVNPDGFYRLSLRDVFGDGMNGYIAVYQGSIPILSNLMLYEKTFYDADRTDFNRIDHAFFTGKVPPNYFTLQLKFDKFPKDTWWRLESITDNVVLANRPPGWYNERFELMTILERIPVFGARPDGIVPEYRFTIGDSYPCDNDPTQTCGDGICCNYGQGKYELFAGPVEDNILLTSGGEYQLREEKIVSAPDSFSAIG